MKKLLLFFSIVILACGVAFAQKNEKPNQFFKPQYIKHTMKEATFWQLKHPLHKLTAWTNGAFYAGVFATYETTGSKRIYRALLDMGEKNDWNPGKRAFHADDHAICQTYIDLYRIAKDKKMISPCIETMDSVMENPYPASGFHSINWWWCDALFMGPPVLAMLGNTLNDNHYFTFLDKLYHECYDLLYDKDEHLFARDVEYKWTGSPDDQKEENGEKIFWSRGNGWVLGGLVRVLQELPADYPSRTFYQNLFIEMAGRIVELQQPDGLWRVSLLDPSSYPGGEASGSGFFCYALAWGINHGILKGEKYDTAVQKVWIGLNGLIHKNGMVGWVQPIGRDPKKNFSENSWEVYGTGAFLLAGSEIFKMTK